MSVEWMNESHKCQWNERMNLVHSSWILQSLDPADKAETPRESSKALEILTGGRPSWAVVTFRGWRQVLRLWCQTHTSLLKSPRRATSVFSMVPLGVILNVWFLPTALLRYHSHIIQFRYHKIWEYFNHLRMKTCPRLALTSLPAFSCTPKSWATQYFCRYGFVYLGRDT